MTHSSPPSHPVDQHKQLDKHFLKASPTSSKDIQASDIKALLQNKGKVTLNEKELTLKDPSPTDPHLQAIVNEPTLSVNPVGTSSKNGECEYDLISSRKKVRVRIACRTLK